MIFVWLGLLIVFIVIEAMTVAMVSVWFAGGALLALVAAAIKMPLWAQIAVFLVTSIALLLLFLPLIKKKQQIKRTPTNADRILEMKALVTETVDAIAGTGEIKVDGKLWSAKSETGDIIEKGSLVRILRIEGVKAVVIPETSATENAALEKKD